MSKINKFTIDIPINGYDSTYIFRDYGNKIVISVSIENELEQHLTSIHSPKLIDYLRYMGETNSTIIEISDENCITLLNILAFPF